MRCGRAYSFAKTPLKAAQAPLATARTSHEDRVFVFGIVRLRNGCWNSDEE